MTAVKRCALILAVAGVLLPAPAAAENPRTYRAATQASVTYELRTMGRWRVERVGQVAAEAEDGISGDLILGLGSRETNMRPIVGGGYFENGRFIVTGEDRGWLQINERFHARFLETHRGALTGSWSLIFDSALPRGRVPGLTDSERYAISLLQSNIAYATRFGVPAGDAVRTAVAGYNSGIGPAVSAYLTTGNPDRFTTLGNYSADALDRRAKIRRARRALGWSAA